MLHIAVTNWTDVTLSFQNPKGHLTPVASPASIGSGATMTITVNSGPPPMSAAQGSFDLSGGGVAFTINYIQLPSSQVALEMASETYGYVVALGQPLYGAASGGNVTATINLYKGRESGTNAPYGFAVPLAHTPYTQANNCADLANSVYGPYMRQPTLVSAKFEQPITNMIMRPADFTGGQIMVQGGLVDTLFNALVNNTGSDGKVLNFLANYLLPQGGPGMNMWVPALRWSGMTSTGLPAYEIHGYTLYPFNPSYQGPARWQMNESVLKLFLGLLVSGAHFVAISANADFDNQNVSHNGSRSLLDAFVNSGLPQCRDPGNSHYCAHLMLNFTGKYYLDISQDWAPPGSGLLLALLFGSTVNARGATTLSPGTYNTFMQLEGWQATVTKSKRHEKDYSAHQQSLWNFSTYGASPYSEKRGTAVFLAPSQWTPQIYSDTFMMPYVGAYQVATYFGTPPVKIQGPALPDWFDTSVIGVPNGRPAAPSQYTVNVYQS